MSVILQLENIGYTTSNQSFSLQNITFDVHEGEWLSVIGPNGSGKSTLSKIMMGLIDYQSGQLFFQNQVVTSQNFHDYRDQIGYVFQNPDNQFVGITVEEDIAFGLENRQVPSEQMADKIKDILNLVDMTAYAQTAIDELSGGQKQRVALASAMVLNPKVLILDEATTMIDPQSRQELFQVLKKIQVEKGVAIVSVTHDRQELSFSDRIVSLNNGQVIDIIDAKQYQYTAHAGLTKSVVDAVVERFSLFQQQETINLSIESVVNELWTSYIKT
ncbi:ATP-binding cassette domain-containing protein [Carnobacteriaceae bacterium zg-ZUI252]|nr:ATP-binding cassette domain-containing protein [Carnobacteriaceae bacterium zg-ZUI252]QTU82415.1 ATP-binding cassette domain-containing protein [Carnobacteriaceae bacterium zg-C25]